MSKKTSQSISNNATCSLTTHTHTHSFFKVGFGRALTINWRLFPKHADVLSLSESTL